VTSMAPRIGIVVGVLQYVAGGSALLLPLAFLLFRATEAAPKNKVPWYDALAAFLCFVIPWYVVINYQKAALGGWGIAPPGQAIVLGVIMCVFVLEAARRTGGKSFAVAVVVLALAPFYSHLLPGILRSLPNSFDEAIGRFFLSADGVFGSVMQTYIMTFLLFIFFGVLLQSAGAGRFFTNVALVFMGMARGGAAKVAVIASGLFGMISGSASSNVIVSGSFTIPMMKQAGFPSHVAAAVEAAASEGGIIMPPVMGAVAFIMANYLGLPYYQVAIAAAVPAFLYYFSLFAQVHFHAVNHGIGGLPRSQVPPLRKSLVGGLHIIVVFITLIFLLFVMKMIPGVAALWSMVVLIAGMAVRKETRPSLKSLSKLMDDAARVLGQLAGLLLAVGLIIGGIALSGLDTSITQWLRSGVPNVAIQLLVLFVACFVLGTGLPGSAMFILLVILLGPALESMGLNRLAVSMTILYWGLIADFTPPTAITPFIASGIAGSSPMRTCIQTMRFGAVIYVVPFFFIFHPVLLFVNFEIASFLLTFLSALLGFWLMARAFEGFGPPWNWFKEAKRVTCGAASIMILSMVWFLAIPGAVLGAILLLSDPVRGLLRRSVPGQEANAGSSDQQ